MIGQLVFGSGGPRQGEREKLYGLPVLRVRADMDSFWWERRVKKAGRALFRGGARRVLVPRGFPCWPLLSEYGLAPVDPGPFLRAQSPALALALLERRGAAPDRSTVVLCGARADWEMTRVAVTLCSQVRNLVIDAPKGGEELARWLRGEFGVPILPRREGGQAALCFHPDGARGEEPTLELYGHAPDLAGLSLSAPHLGEGDREDLDLLAALYEFGRLDKEELKIT